MSVRPDDHRRKWDKEEYAKKAEKRKQEERDKEDAKKNKNKEPPVQRELLKPHEKKFNFDAQVGTRRFVTPTTGESDGYFCEVCDVNVKNSTTYLDHVNGRKHQKNLGMSMKVERSSLDAVKKRFELAKLKREEKQQEYDLAERLKDLAQEEEKFKEYKKEVRQQKKRKAEVIDEIDEEAKEISKFMGFDGFNTSKKSK